MLATPKDLDKVITYAQTTRNMASVADVVSRQYTVQAVVLTRTLTTALSIVKNVCNSNKSVIFAKHEYARCDERGEILEGDASCHG